MAKTYKLSFVMDRNICLAKVLSDKGVDVQFDKNRNIFLAVFNSSQKELYEKTKKSSSNKISTSFRTRKITLTSLVISPTKGCFLLVIFSKMRFI